MYVTTNSLYESIGTLIDSNFTRTFEINRIPQIITKKIFSWKNLPNIIQYIFMYLKMFYNNTNILEIYLLCLLNIKVC